MLRRLSFLTFVFGLVATQALALEEPWRMPASLEEFQQQFESEMAAAKAARAKLLATKGPRTTANTLVPYDEIQFRLSRASTSGGTFRDLHPDAAWRAAGEKAVLEVIRYGAELSLDRNIYDALTAVSDVPADAKWYVERTLASLKRGGVLLPDEQRKEVEKLRNQLASLELKYSGNLARNRREIRIPAAQLDTMPPDFLKSHPAGPDGMIAITNDAGDHDSVMAYAQNAAVRKQAALLFTGRGYPENSQVVTDLIRTRHQIAKLTGYPNFAEYAAESRMVGSVKKHREFLQSVDRASEAGAKRELAELLAQKRKDDPTAQRLNAEDLNYYERLTREAKFQYDDRKAREYLPYVTVKDAVLGTAAALFEVEYRPLKNVSTWHPSVEVYEVIDHGKTIGRFYLDMHPRPNKFQHFASGLMRTGVAGRQLPEAILLCNFPDPANGPALIESERTRTFFHEFGHLMHTIFAGQQRWAGATRPESDFIEAPSQLLEEWLKDPELLVRFTKHYKTGERMPIEMARSLIAAKDFGKARRARAGAALAWAFLDMQDDPEPIADAGPIYRSHYERLGLPLLEGTHIDVTISHMGSGLYSAAYYTYLWSQVIAKDLFSRFSPKDMLGGKVAREYRDKVLAPGGTRPAAVLVQDFLGRPFNEKAFEKWLSQ
jgi:thimet oligopeptidase